MRDTVGPLIVALDVSSESAAMVIAHQLDPNRCRLKVGKQLYTREGPMVVTKLQALGFEVFLDLKFHDIPNTVAAAVEAAADLGVWMVNVHASGGSRMLRAAAEALECREKRPLLTAVTVLTSMSSDDLCEIGITAAPLHQVRHLALLASRAGLDGVVCSAQEASSVREVTGDEFLRVTPGIRLPGEEVADQRRVLTPVDAMVSGATHLVMGRSITSNPTPSCVVDAVLASLSATNNSFEKAIASTDDL